MLKEELDINCTEPVFLTDKKNRHMKVAKHRKFCLSQFWTSWFVPSSNISKYLAKSLVSLWCGMNQNKYLTTQNKSYHSTEK